MEYLREVPLEGTIVARERLAWGVGRERGERERERGADVELDGSRLRYDEISNLYERAFLEKHEVIHRTCDLHWSGALSFSSFWSFSISIRSNFTASSPTPSPYV